jgi:peptidyl-dipeptidase A
LVVLLAATAGPAPAPGADEGPDLQARHFLAGYESALRPLEIEVARCTWNANLSGSDDAYRAKREAESRLHRALADSGALARLKALGDARPGDPLLARQIDVLDRQYLATQADAELLAELVTATDDVQRTLNAYRPLVDGRQLTANDVRRVLRQSDDSACRRAVWEAAKEVGRTVEPELKRLVKLRNQVARRLGLRNYYALQFFLGQQREEDVLRLFDDLDALTRRPYHAAKAEIDAALAARCRIDPAQLRPWHYHDPFAQLAPAVFGGGSEGLYASIDVVRVCRDFYAGIGLPVDDVLRRSDLYEKPGKSPHAFCTDLDRAGDVRILVNIVPGRQWLTTTLHELGHAVYSSRNIPATVPYALRTEAHSLTTEGVAMLFERLAGNPDWLQAMGVAVPEPARFRRQAARLRRNQLLMFSRFCQVMFRFERALYENPDQDLNRLWWDLVEKYQEIQRPNARNAPDYASKLHIVSAPAYFHNYMLGALFASQLHHAIVRELFPGADPARAVYVGHAEVGRFLIRRVFALGNTLPWNELTLRATGETLNVRAFIADITAGGDTPETTPAVAPR